MTTVAVLVGSLRRDSINRKFAESIGKLAGERLTFQFVDIGDLPLYNEDLWENTPESVTRLKQEVEAADAVLFVTPEYNRSFSPAIKNAIDWGTRPYGKNSWATKPSAVIGTSPGATGAASGQNALRGLLTVVDTVHMAQPEVYFVYKPELFDADNNIVDQSTKDFLNRFVDRFAKWIDQTSEPKTKAQPDAHS
ncbi:NAD(P)H-dependent oxidoreductase [Rhizobium sp. CFBP 8762]|uniref:NADPH-dependent FMN reductase n=1 Tax=Rhizobium sp. CFBP 8762 TaxID=2775279 RepID=UPI00177F4EA7|nr:NADPH-dependent FMN reductase [Rhizobium sp. CFBP 8762]MBD8554213.1 NAD(P)H-dependent oxidoreductase [Rhizobium sp. CFBP 8762]